MGVFSFTVSFKIKSCAILLKLVVRMFGLSVSQISVCVMSVDGVAS